MIFGLALAVGVLALILAVSSPPFLRALDAGLHRAQLAERYARFRAGLPLRGTPDLTRLDARLAAKGLKAGDPIFVRIFKRELELELWMRKGDRFVLFATYPICRFSGAPGPKLKEGDRQSPEGFYTVARQQLNPNSRWHRAFNLGFPNPFDRAHGRTGSFLMVHGGCGSIGCYAMTDPVIDEIWRLATAALDGGQDRFGVHVLPFRMTADNLRLRGPGRWQSFWRDLAKGSALFEREHVPPKVSVCRGRYVVEPGARGSDGSAPIALHCPKEQNTS